MRKFEVVSDNHRINPCCNIQLPKRATKNSACYDIYCPCEVELMPFSNCKIHTDVKAAMNPGEVLMVYPRSSMGKMNVMIANTVGVIDCDYYSNESNDGNIIVMLHNLSDCRYFFHAGDRIAQCMFVKYETTDDDDADGVRTGGIGSTGV